MIGGTPDCTYFMYYDLNHQGGPQWVYPGGDVDIDYLENTAITFQWTSVEGWSAPELLDTFLSGKS